MIYDLKEQMAYWIPETDLPDYEPEDVEYLTPQNEWFPETDPTSQWRDVLRRWPMTYREQAQAWMDMHCVFVPEGWEVCGYGFESDDNTTRLLYDVAVSSIGSTFNSQFPVQLRKAEPPHKEPELVYCLQSDGSGWLRVEKDEINSRPLKQLRKGYRQCPEDLERWDLILAEDVSKGAHVVWLGHWNDGPKKES